MNRPAPASPPPGPTEGAIANGVHVLPVRVYYEDTDAAGIVYYANYLKFAERARTEMLRRLGATNSWMMEGQGLAFAVSQCRVDYLKPARLDDSLRVHTKVIQVGGASLRAEQVISRDADRLVRMRLRLACTDRAGRPARLPVSLRASLKDLCNQTERG